MTPEILKATEGVDGKAKEESKGAMSWQSGVEVRNLSQSWTCRGFQGKDYILHVLRRGLRQRTFLHLQRSRTDTVRYILEAFELVEILDFTK